MAKQVEHTIAGLVGASIVAALALGYAVGVLSAPQSGRVTRAKLKAKAAKLAENATEYADAAADKVRKNHLM